jgi:hypothetical protein
MDEQNEPVGRDFYVGEIARLITEDGNAVPAEATANRILTLLEDTGFDTEASAAERWGSLDELIEQRRHDGLEFGVEAIAIDEAVAEGRRLRRPVPLCPLCGEPLTVEGFGDGDEPQHVFCDICGLAEHPADLTPDWNGETGSHLSCERGEGYVTVEGRTFDPESKSAEQQAAQIFTDAD